MLPSQQIAEQRLGGRDYQSARSAVRPQSLASGGESKAICSVTPSVMVARGPYARAGHGPFVWPRHLLRKKSIWSDVMLAAFDRFQLRFLWNSKYQVQQPPFAET